MEKIMNELKAELQLLPKKRQKEIAREQECSNLLKEAADLCECTAALPDADDLKNINLIRSNTRKVKRLLMRAEKVFPGVLALL